MASDVATGQIIFIATIFAVSVSLIAIGSIVYSYVEPIRPQTNELTELANTRLSILTVIYDAEADPDTLTIFAKNEGTTSIRFEELFLYVSDTLIDSRSITIEEDTRRTRDNIWEPTEIIKIEVLGAIATGTRDVRLQTSLGVNAARTHFFLSNLAHDAQIIEYPTGICTMELGGVTEVLQGSTESYQGNITWDFARAGNLASTVFLRDGIQICSISHSGVTGSSSDICPISFPNEGNITVTARGVFGQDGIQCEDTLTVEVEPVIDASCIVSFTSFPTNTTEGETEQVTASLEWEGANSVDDRISIEFLRGSTPICSQQYSQESGIEFEDCNINFPNVGLQEISVRGNFEQSGILCSDTVVVDVEEDTVEEEITACNIISFDLEPTPSYEGQQFTATTSFEANVSQGDNVGIQITGGPGLDVSNCGYESVNSSGAYIYSCSAKFDTQGTGRSITASCVEDNSPPVLDFETITDITIQQSTCPAGMAGTGTQSAPCQITTPSQFLVIDDSATNWALHYELMNDIDMSSVSFNGLRRDFDYFTGSFNGNFNRVYGFEITSSIASSGVFSRVRGTVRNVKFEGNGTFNEGESGGAVGRLDGTSSSNRAIVSNVSFTGNIILQQQDTGGLVGQMYGNSLVENSFFQGNISINGFARGPLVGRVLNSANTISNSFANAELTSSSVNHGGLLISQISGGSPTEIEYVLGLGSSNVISGFVGGVVMEGSGTTTYTQAYWNTDSNLPHAVGSGFDSGDDPSGTIARTTAQLKQGASAYPTWNTNIWGFNNSSRNEGYPYLRWYYEN